MSPLTRRRFLGDVSAAAAVSLLPRTLGAEPEKGAPPAPGPNGRLRVAVIGVRGQGRAHLRWLLDQPDTDVAAVVDADLAPEIIGPAVKMVEKSRGKPPAVVQDLRKMLDDKSIDAVTIATPDHWHALAAVWALQAGKDVYVEKPVSHGVREGRVIVDWARKLGRIAQTGTQGRSCRAMIDMAAYVRSGKLGKIAVARALTYKKRDSIGRPEGDGSIPPTVDHDVYCGPAPLRPPRRRQYHYDWHWFYDYAGGGDLPASGVHQLDTLRWAIGKEGLPKGVVSFGGRYVWDDNGETPNTQMTLFDYGDVTVVSEVRNIASTDYRNHPRAGIGILFHGSEGTLVCNGNSQAVVFDPKGAEVTRFEGGGDHMRNFLDAVKSRRREDLAADILEGHVSSALCYLGSVAYRAGRAVPFGDAPSLLGNDPETMDVLERTKEHLRANGVDLAKEKIVVSPRLTLDPAAERFTGDGAAAANAFLTREYRAPYELPGKA